MTNKDKELYAVEILNVLVDKGSFDTEAIKRCDVENIITYVSKLTFANGINDSRYFFR